MSDMLSIVMITLDRGPDMPNYFAETVVNLRRSGLAQGVIVSDSGSSLEYFERSLTDQGIGFVTEADAIPIDEALAQDYWYVDRPIKKRNANQNFSTSLRLAGLCNAEWVLFLEDDIDVCDQFIASVEAWLHDHATEDYRVYPLGANYTFVGDGSGATAALYPIDAFYGTQAMAIRRDDALNLSMWLESPDLAGYSHGYDILMHDWAKKTWPYLTHFLTPQPSFVQHIGRRSVIAPRPETHTFPSWPGRNWMYRSRVKVTV